MRATVMYAALSANVRPASWWSERKKDSAAKQKPLSPTNGQHSAWQVPNLLPDNPEHVGDEYVPAYSKQSNTSDNHDFWKSHAVSLPPSRQAV